MADFMSESDEGEMLEIKKSVDETIHDLIITPEETAKRHENLYAQEPILTINNLKTYFPVREGLFSKVVDHVKAVDDVTFDVYPGETLGLVGESGCGKTTLGRTILRLIEPTAGNIIFHNKDITNISGDELREIRRRIQIIFQDPYSSLNPRITIGSAIMEPMQVHQLHGDDQTRRQKVQELLERVNLDPSHYNRYPHEFSGGQRQRICIARALAVQPEFVICDESVSALDVSVQAQVLNLLNELRDEFGLTYIFISHDLSVVKFMSDRMVVMNEGKVEEMGDADSVYQDPQTDYTKRLIAAIPRGDLHDIKKSYLSRKTE
jgi:peptide/nickel transport system ATP-binding protein